MKTFLALALTCCVPAGLAAEDPAVTGFPLGTESVLVLDDPAPNVRELACARPGQEAASDCVSVDRAVLTGRMQRVAIRDRARWM